MTRKFSAPLLGALALTAVSFVGIPAAQADVCGDVGGRHVSVGGCTPGIAGAAIDGAVIGAAVDHPFGYGEPAVGYPAPAIGYPAPVGWPPLPPGYLAFPSFPGEMPCYLPTGQPYYTPADMPCFPA